MPLESGADVDARGGWVLQTSLARASDLIIGAPIVRWIIDNWPRGRSGWRMPSVLTGMMKAKMPLLHCFVASQNDELEVARVVLKEGVDIN
jgi:hypothetical protein